MDYDGTVEPGKLKEIPRTLAERVAIIEELIAHPQMTLEARWTDEQAEKFREEFDQALKTAAPNGRPRAWDYQMASFAPALTPDAIRDLIRECVTIVKPGEVLAVRLPLDMTPGDMDRARAYALEVEEQCGVKVAFLPGEEFAAITQDGTA